MSDWIKAWTREHLSEIVTALYPITLDSLGCWQDQKGKIIQWAIRDSKLQEPWVFSITAAMSLKPVVEKSAESIALEISLALNAQNLPAWEFVHQGTYINAFFVPMPMNDLLSHKEPLDWPALLTFKDGPYARYRLEMIRRALLAIGTEIVSKDCLITETAKNQLMTLLNYPSVSPTDSEAGKALWNTWLNRICSLTQKGELRGLDSKTESLLLCFADACLFG